MKAVAFDLLPGFTGRAEDPDTLSGGKPFRKVSQDLGSDLTSESPDLRNSSDRDETVQLLLENFQDESLPKLHAASP